VASHRAQPACRERPAFLHRRDSSAGARSSRPPLHKSRCRFPGDELADDPSKLCCLVIIVRVGIDNNMERVVARHLPEAGPQSRRRFGALQIHQHPMPFFASLFRDCESNRSADALPVSKHIVPLPRGIPIPSWAEAPRFEIAG
jgi:hypothetical protein